MTTPYAEAGPPDEAALSDVLAALRASDADRADAVQVEPAVSTLLRGVMAGSPHLAAALQRQPALAASLLASDPDQRLEALLAGFRATAGALDDAAAMMRAVRDFKSEAALMIALCDLGGVWPVMRVTDVLTRTADAAVSAIVSFLFRQAARRGDWLARDTADPAADSGYIVLGMGKYGAFELNYSSDIDLIVFYDPDKTRIRPGLEPQAFFVRLTRDLLRYLQERTGDGYVFRTDLRLRPDPGATQIALSTTAALGYYESFGQNWERAALIKARPVAGDLAAGADLLRELSPFIWRKYLDFAAIADIHAMKRQIHAARGFGRIAVAGHNIKLGRGGIREIEFFAQTQQLIAGGRQSNLRVSQTLAALQRLAQRQWIEPHVASELDEVYRYLRSLEHRLQMVADEQTHELPDDPAKLETFARFAGYASSAALGRDLTRRLETVQRHYAGLFEHSPALARAGTNMVFAGSKDDPATLEALGAMGYSQPSEVIAAVRGWHHGRYAAVRSARSRERLTEVQPVLIEALARTANPDAAFASFDRFLSLLPTGVQLFALLKANANLMRLVADIMGSAPRLARILGRQGRVLDAVLDPRVIGALPAPTELEELIGAELRQAKDFQDVLDRARIVGSEHAFLIGVRLLSGIVRARDAGLGFSHLAEKMIQALHEAVAMDFARAHGRVEGGAAAVVAMGRLGGQEMTAASDLDLIVVYDFHPDTVQSDGARPLPVSLYFARLTQRLISALSAPTAEGQLYSVDMRLRPSGQKGPVATQLSSFVHYQANEAWTWEHMALTRARVVSGPPALRNLVETAIRDALVRPRERARVARDVREMRDRIAAEKGTSNAWDLKQARGGLVDIEFMAQHLQLVAAAACPEVLQPNTAAALRALQRSGALSAEAADVLVPAVRLLHDLSQILRLCLDDPFQPDLAPDGLKDLLARVAEAPSFAYLDAHLRDVLAQVSELFDTIVV